jgi:hypothetical protein
MLLLLRHEEAILVENMCLPDAKVAWPRGAIDVTLWNVTQSLCLEWSNSLHVYTTPTPTVLLLFGM